MKFYENPDCVPLEDLQLNIKNDGVVIMIHALNAKWADKRCFVRYEAPEIYNSDGSEIEGARERWLEITGYIIEDLNWLLKLPFYRFWSNIVYNTSIIDTLVSFLQEAPPFYALESFPNIPEMLESLESLRRNVLIAFARLVTNKESSTEYMSSPFLGKLLYDNYIFTIPIIFDLCQLYGRENAKVIKKIVQNLFDIQSMYNDDLQKSVPCLIKALENVERRFGSCLNDTSKAIALLERSENFIEMTLCNLEDLILYTLDVSSTITVLLNSYSPVITVFHRDDFMNKIISLYGNTIPEMYKKLDKLAYNDENMPKYMELKHRLDVTRIELLNLYRIIIYEPILNIQKNINTISESEIREHVDEYLDLLMNATSEKEFIIDYHQFYPINSDVEIVSKLYPEIDTVKREYILQLLSTSIGNDIVSNKISTNASYNNTNEFIAGPSGIQNDQKKHPNYMNCTNSKSESALTEQQDEVLRLISQVKEILCDCGEGFIQQCLNYYNNHVESVINAVIEDNLPSDLKEIDRTLPYIPPDSMEPLATMDLAIGGEVPKISDNYEFDVTEYDNTNMKIYQKKRKDNYRNANEMFNDKSEINKSRNIYEKYSVIDDYDDEYDDTYDSHDIGNTRDDSTEVGLRPFTIPRILRANDKNISSEDDTEVEDEKPVQNDHFVQNPAELRAKAEQRKQSKESKNKYDVIGKAKGKGQDKDVLTNRHKKNVHKATHSNHNRRVGSQIKKKQGMIPF